MVFLHSIANLWSSRGIVVAGSILHLGHDSYQNSFKNIHKNTFTEYKETTYQFIPIQQQLIISNLSPVQYSLTVQNRCLKHHSLHLPPLDIHEYTFCSPLYIERQVVWDQITENFPNHNIIMWYLYWSSKIFSPWLFRPFVIPVESSWNKKIKRQSVFL